MTRFRKFAALTALLLLLTAVVTYPQVLHMRTGVADFGDPLLNAWALAWVDHALLCCGTQIPNANIFYPEHATLALSETLMLPAVLVAPARLVGLNPIALHNLTLLSGFVLSGLAIFVLVEELTGQWRAALVAAIIFALYPLRSEHYPRVQLQLTYLMPLALLQIHRIATKGWTSWRASIMLGLCMAGQFYSCVYYSVFLATLLPIFAAVLAVFNRTRARAMVGQLTVATVISVTLVAPMIPAYMHNRGEVGERTVEELARWSAEFRDYLQAPPDNLLYGRGFGIGPAERRLFPGYTVVLLASTGFFAPASLVAPYVAATVVAVDASRGLNGHTYKPLFDYVLPYRALRVPARFAMLAGMFLAILAGLGTARVVARLPSAAANAYVAVVAGLVIVESMNRPIVLRDMPLALPPVYEWLRHAPPGPVVEYPVDGLEGRIGPQDPTYMYYSTAHWLPLLNGFSAFAPPSYQDLLQRLQPFPTQAGIDYLRGRGAKYLLVHSAYYLRGGFEEDIAALRLVNRVRLAASFHSTNFGTTNVYELDER